MRATKVTLGWLVKLTKRKPDVGLVWLACASILVGCDKNTNDAGRAAASNPPVTEPYTPPVMPPFPPDYEGVVKAFTPYFRDGRSIDFFFEMYVTDVIEELPRETVEALAEFSRKHPDVFKSYDRDWKKFVAKETHLSDTAEIAIWDLWIRNSETARNQGWVQHPWHFAQLFSANYFAEGSQVDVWEDNALEMAKHRIETYRKNQSEPSDLQDKKHGAPGVKQ